MLRTAGSRLLRLSLAVPLAWLWAPSAAALDWTFEIADQGPGMGGYSSIAIGASGDVHIAYFDGSHGIAKYARRAASTWDTEVLDGQFLCGHYTSIKLDSFGTPRVAYRFYSGHNLRYATRDGSWTHDDFETDPDMEADVSLALDSDDLPHIAYWDGEFQGEPHDLVYARFDGAAWRTEIVDSAGDVGRNASLALDSRDRPHISYYDQTHSTLKHAYFDGAVWRTETVDGVEVVAFNFRTAIAVDSRDRVHIVYSAYQYQSPDWYGQLKYAVLEVGLWTVMVVDQSLPNRDFRVPALALDSADLPRASYLIYYNAEPITADLKYAAFDGSAWRTEFVDTGDIADSDFSNSIALDPWQEVHISYARSGQLVHAYAGSPAGAPERPGAGAPDLVLLPPFPNPSRGTATISYRVQAPGPVGLDVVTVTGRRVAHLATRVLEPGLHRFEIRDPLPPGVYLCTLAANGRSTARKLIVR